MKTLTTMARAEFDHLLTELGACEAAHAWCATMPDATPMELWGRCEDVDWLLWLVERLGTAVPHAFGYACANRALGYAVTALDQAGVPHGLAGLVVADAATADAAGESAYSAYCAASAASSAARHTASAASSAAYSASSAAVGAARHTAYAAGEAGNAARYATGSDATERTIQAAHLRELLA